MKSLVELWHVNTVIQPYSPAGSVIKDMNIDIGVSFVNAKDHTKDIYWRTTLSHVDMYNFDWCDIKVFSPLVGYFSVGYFIKATWKRMDGVKWLVKNDRCYR